MSLKVARISLIALLLLLALPTAQAQKTRLATPSDVKFSISKNSLVWDAVDHAFQYEVRWRVGNARWQTAKISLSRLFYRFSQLPLSGRVRMQVRAVAAGGSNSYSNSAWSDVVKVTLSLPRLAVPANLRLNKGVLIWDAVPNVGRYQIRWRVGNEGWQSIRLGSGRLSYDFTDLPYDQTITFQMRALARTQSQDYENSDWSSLFAVQLNNPGGDDTGTAKDTATATATNTPVPTDTPTATNTPVPTDTPTATNTPVPTDTPTATNTATPEPAALKQPNNFRHTGGWSVAWDGVQGAIGYLVSYRTGSSSMTHDTGSTQFTIPNGKTDIAYTVFVHARGDGVNYWESGGIAGPISFTVVSTATPTNTPVPTATATATNTDVPAPSGGGSNDDDDDDDRDGNNGGTRTEPDPVCVPKETCSSSSGTWTVTSSRRIQHNNRDTPVCGIYERTLQQYTCTTSCNGGSRQYNKVVKDWSHIRDEPC